MKFKDYIPLYLSSYQTVNTVEHQTYIRKYLIPLLGNMELNEIKPVHVMQALASADKRLKTSGTVKKIIYDIKKIMSTAYVNDLCEKDISNGIVYMPYKRMNDRNKVKSFTKEEIAFIFSEKSFVSDLFFFQFLTGMRAEEILALKWERVKQVNGNYYVTVCAVICNNCGNRYYTDTTKSRYSRTIKLMPQAVDIIERLPHINDFVFANQFNCRNSDYLTPSWHSHNWIKFFNRRDKEYVNLYGKHLPYLSAHKLRHSFALISLENGCSLPNLSLYLGHCDTSTTTRYYLNGRADEIDNPIFEI
ncbi:tyrosine-type recombinase/integrase [Ruminococcus sp. Marseille-P6503]|uniref:tyrosine-type recombinase/integrase n=1 Tax=Ruminococcus sp. Marseille-P6503 TaxID=2364796 RepID=UPI0013DDFED1|nr:tyrosine-type recombinase/integrase [Ruminococcus sp. Marseille-P6503]